ncbi:PhnD/SsuA/transferrin family substrate-binding protein [Erwinia sp. E_sp_W01_6]|uniref:PhnD/SsuA/transferrin family substrate-binding protein n=1 Tax=Erwinia sp. E_sp_W01_6 TaxID=3039408 RepID=UPI0030D0C4E0
MREGAADIAAIDCVSWALLLRDFPAELAGLKIIDRTASVPGLPLITSAETPVERVAALRDGLTQVVNDPANRPMLNALLIKDFSPFPALPGKLFSVDNLGPKMGCSS